MRFRYLLFIGLLCSFGLSSCNRYIKPNRTFFIQKNNEIPTPDVTRFKSPQLRPGQDEELGVAIAISGGGARAANFGVGILMGLEQIRLESKSNVLGEIDYLSSVSGGGFAAGAYLNSLYNHKYWKDPRPYSLSRDFHKGIKQDLLRSYLKPMLREFFLSPKSWFTHIDEGDALELSIDNHVLGYKKRKQANREFYPKRKDRPKPRSLTLGDFYIDKNDDRPVQFPMMVANATNYHSMAIFPFTPDIMDYYEITGYSHRKKRLHDKTLKDPYEIPLSVGIKASGSFPVAISNTTMESGFHEKKCFLHLIDGGLSDNMGYKTAFELLKKDPIAKRKTVFMVDADNWGTRSTFSTKERAAASVNVLGSLTYSSLESRYVVMRKEVGEACDLYGIHPIYLGFDELILGNTASPPEKIEIKTERTRLVHLLKTNRDNISPVDMQILYELCLAVPTKYSITEEEQQLMIFAGYKVVEMQKEEIRDFFNDTVEHEHTQK